MVTLTAEQTTTLPFPIGCPVWYSVGEAPILKRGTVSSVTLVDKSLPWEYTIEGEREGEDVVSDEVPESRVCFSDNCPVLVFKSPFSRAEPPWNDPKDEGIVMFGEIRNGENRYTVMIPNKDSPKTRIEENVEEGRLMFRNPPQKTLEGHVEEDQPTAATAQATNSSRKRARGSPT